MVQRIISNGTVRGFFIEATTYGASTRLYRMAKHPSLKGTFAYRKAKCAFCKAMAGRPTFYGMCRLCGKRT